MSNVTSFKGNTPEGQPVPAIVETLEHLLEKAKAGDITALAYAAAYTEGNGFANGWDGNGGTRDQLGAAIGYLSHRYFADAYED